MSLFVLDTDILSLYRRGQPLIVQRMLQQSLNTLATTAITVEEQLTGWYTLLSSQHCNRRLKLLSHDREDEQDDVRDYRSGFGTRRSGDPPRRAD